MPWHLRSIRHACEHRGCERAATQQLFSPSNDPAGRYCGRHAAAALADIQRGMPS